ITATLPSSLPIWIPSDLRPQRAASIIPTHRAWQHLIRVYALDNRQLKYIPYVFLCRRAGPVARDVNQTDLSTKPGFQLPGWEFCYQERDMDLLSPLLESLLKCAVQAATPRNSPTRNFASSAGLPFKPPV